MQLRCAQCNVPVTSELRHLSDLSQITLEDQKELIPSGWYVTAEEIRHLYPSDTIVGDEFILSLRDLVSAHPAGIRNGCCGADGLDGPNLFCPEGHPIATEVSDCWTAHFIHCQRDFVRPS